MPNLSERSLRRVLQSLITATLYAQPLRNGRAKNTAPWTDEFALDEGGADALGCDSLEMLGISSAVNEMFHLYEAGLETRLLQATTFGDWVGFVEEAWRRGVGSLTVSTSGSTGRPKLCTHTFASLGAEADFLAEFFRGRRRVVTYTPAHHIYGILFGGMLPDRLDVPVVDLQDAGTAAHGEASGGGGVLQAGDLVVSFPEGWGWIERSFGAMPGEVEGVTSTAPCPRALLDALMKQGLSRIVEVYGSSETAGIGMRVWPETHYRLMPRVRRVAEAVEGSDRLQTVDGQVLPVMDELQFFPDDTFVVNGRKDGCVQVGGVNVSPAVVERRLREHPEVAEVRVELMRAEEGQRLRCHAVPRPGCDASRLKQVLQEQIASWPKAAERPVVVVRGEASEPEAEAGAE